MRQRGQPSSAPATSLLLEGFSHLLLYGTPAGPVRNLLAHLELSFLLDKSLSVYLRHCRLAWRSRHQRQAALPCWRRQEPVLTSQEWPEIPLKESEALLRSCSPPGSDGLHSPWQLGRDICLCISWRCPEALHSSVFRLSLAPDLPRHLKFHCGQCLVGGISVPCLYIADCARGRIKLWQSLTPQCWAVLPAPESQPESLAHRICTF